MGETKAMPDKDGTKQLTNGWTGTKVIRNCRSCDDLKFKNPYKTTDAAMQLTLEKQQKMLATKGS